MLKFRDGTEIFRKAESEETLSVIIAGDCCPWHTAIVPIKKGKSKEILKEIQPHLDSADISIIQWETPLTNDNTPINKSGPNLKCPPECVKFAKVGKFDIALLANNHIGDFGQSPVVQTIDTLEKNGIKTVGAGKNITKAIKPLFFEKNGFKVAVVNIAEHEFGTAGKNKAGSAPLEPLDNIKIVKQAASKADIMLVIIHGGNETNPIPSPRMIKTYRAFAESGASAVINIHTHCPQGIELWNGVPIIYCPGNFFFPSPWREFSNEDFWWTGYLPKLSFDRKGAFAVEITPYIFSSDPYRIVPFNGQKKENFCQYLAEISAIIAKNEAEKYFDAWCTMFGGDQISSIQNLLIDAPEQLMTLRNHFTCEAHNELKTNYLRLLEEVRVSEAEKLIPELQRLQHAVF